MPERLQISLTYWTEDELIVNDLPQEVWLQVQKGEPKGQLSYFNGKLEKERLTLITSDQAKQLHEWLLGLLIVARSKEFLTRMFPLPFD
jgi:hypothetical protein